MSPPPTPPLLFKDRVRVPDNFVLGVDKETHTTNEAMYNAYQIVRLQITMHTACKVVLSKIVLDST